MKHILLVLSLIFSMQAFAVREYAQVDVNWSSRYLDESVTLLCDDTYYSGVDVTVPGKYEYSVLSSIIYKDCDASVKITKLKKVIENGEAKVKFRVTTDTSCTLQILEDKHSGKTFELYIADAC